MHFGWIHEVHQLLTMWWESPIGQWTREYSIRVDWIHFSIPGNLRYSRSSSYQTTLSEQCEEGNETIHKREEMINSLIYPCPPFFSFHLQSCHGLRSETCLATLNQSFSYRILFIRRFLMCTPLYGWFLSLTALSPWLATNAISPSLPMINVIYSVAKNIQ